MEGGYEYIKERKWEKSIPLSKVSYINNGVDLEDYYNNLRQFSFKEPILETDRYKIVFTGSSSTSKKFDFIIESAKNNPDIDYIFYGSGSGFIDFENRVKQQELRNIFIQGKVDKKYIPYILSKCDLNLFISDSSPIGRFGLSPNKLFDYFASTHPSILCVDAKFIPGENEGVFRIVKNFDVSELDDTIKYYKNLDKDTLHNISEKCKKMANKYSFVELTNKLEGLMKWMQILLMIHMQTYYAF